NLMVAIQNAVNPLKIGAATATSAYFRSLGGTFGVALSGAIMSVQLHGVQASMLPQTGSRALILEQGIQEILQLSPERRDAVIAIYRYAINTTFLVGAIITALAFLLVLNLPELPLRSGRPSAEG
ncbi:MAG TPA: MFS transporter, partial [Nitrospirota bacterium]|nr:MFS transporter [Nitrospirota bacterium]